MFKSIIIYGVKGEIYDVIIVIFFVSGGNDLNWKSWLKELDSEVVRFVYVVFLRLRYLLIWVVKILIVIEMI